MLACLSIHWSCQSFFPKEKIDFSSSLGVWRDNLLINRLIKKKKVHITIFFSYFLCWEGFSGKKLGYHGAKVIRKIHYQIQQRRLMTKRRRKRGEKGKCLHSSKGFRLLNQRRRRYGRTDWLVGSSVSSKTFFVMAEKVEGRKNIFYIVAFFGSHCLGSNACQKGTCT